MGYQTSVGRIAYLEVERTDLGAASYYYPDANGIELSPNVTGISLQLRTVTDCTITFERSLDRVTWIDITMAGYCLNTNAAGNATYTAPAAVDYEGLQGCFFRVKQVTPDASNVFKMSGYAASRASNM